MPPLPSARGAASALVLDALRREPHVLAPLHRAPADDPIGDDDLQLALYLCYELHYRGFDGVDEGWEWEPSLLALRRDLEAEFEGALEQEVPRDAGASLPAAEEMDVALRAIADAEDSPSLSRHLEVSGSLEQFLEFCVHRSAYQLKEADPHSWALPRIGGAPKAAMVEIQADEYGGGRPERIHADLFARAMRALALDDAYGGGPRPVSPRAPPAGHPPSPCGAAPPPRRRARAGRRLGRVPRLDPGRDARDGHPHVAVRPAPPPARRDRRPPRPVRDALVRAEPPLRDRAAAARPGRGCDGVLRRARGRRRGAREHRGGRPGRRARAPAARALRRRPVGRAGARRGGGALGRPPAGLLGGRPHVAARAASGGRAGRLRLASALASATRRRDGCRPARRRSGRPRPSRAGRASRWRRTCRSRRRGRRASACCRSGSPAGGRR